MGGKSAGRAGRPQPQAAYPAGQKPPGRGPVGARNGGLGPYGLRRMVRACSLGGHGRILRTGLRQPSRRGPRSHPSTSAGAAQPHRHTAPTACPGRPRAPPAAERRGTEVARVMTRQPRPRSLPSRVITPGDAPPAAQPTSRRPLHDERYGPWRARDQGPEGPGHQNPNHCQDARVTRQLAVEGPIN